MNHESVPFHSFHVPYKSHTRFRLLLQQLFRIRLRRGAERRSRGCECAFPLVFMPLHLHRFRDIQFHARFTNLQLRDMEQVEDRNQRRGDQGRKKFALLSVERVQDLPTKEGMFVGT